jgi:phosphoglucomutase/phosphomannomutase
MTVDPEVQARIDAWLNGPYDEQTKGEIRTLLKSNPQKAIDGFYTTLEFGTGGLRGIVGVGSNRINRYTIQGATQGFANFLNKKYPSPSIVIGFDSRIHSRSFAEDAAKVLAANGIKVFLFKELRPTPLVSFACRYLKASGAIMITASHNPPEYNGYKVYNSTGGQVTSPEDLEIIEEVKKIDSPEMVKIAPLDSKNISTISEEIDLAYVKTCQSLQIYPVANKKEGKNLSIVYTSLHGTGITLVPKMLKEWGFSNLSLVDKQCVPDGTFPTVKYPNPEENEALSLGIATLKNVQGDILIATDPDADRIGVVVKHQGQFLPISGNQLACILLEHVCQGLTSSKSMPQKGAFIKTIATSELFRAICEKWKKPCFDTLTGFKYIADLIHNWETKTDGYQFLFGGEESYGYLLGSYVRDKDAVISACLVAEAASVAKLQGKTLLDKLFELYQEHGVYVELLETIKFQESKSGRDEMAALVQKWQQSPPKELAGVKVKILENYHTGEKIHLFTGDKSLLSLPKSDALLFWLEDGSKILLRPSGTEPKVKIYCGVVDSQTRGTIEQRIDGCTKKIKRFIEDLKK